MSKHWTRILIALAALGLLLNIAYLALFKNLVGEATEGLFHQGSCYKNDEFGVTYLVVRVTKGTAIAKIIKSEKYPDDKTKKVHYEEHWDFKENPSKVYPVKCL